MSLPKVYFGRGMSAIDTLISLLGSFTITRRAPLATKAGHETPRP